MAIPEDKQHSPDEIWDYILRNYPALANAKNMAIGVQGNVYRVVVIDGVDVNHTLKIHPKQIDVDRVERLNDKGPPAPTSRDSRSEQIRKAAAFIKAHNKQHPRARDNDREHER